MTVKRSILSALMAISCVMPVTHAVAADYPDRPIRIMVGFAPGGGADLVARMLAPELEKELGQTIVVENRTGAGGSIANTAVSRAKPDGYTLLLGNTGGLAIAPSLLDSQPYDIVTDFVPVASISQTPLIMLVRKDSPLHTFQDLVQAAKDPNQQLSYGTGANGSISHLIAETLKKELGMKMQHIGYRGGSQAVADLLGGQIPMAMDGVAVAGGFLKSGQLRALAVTSENRLKVLPDVPTLEESGGPKSNYQSWYGIAAPKGTPPEIVNRLNTAVNNVLADPSFQRRMLEQQGNEVVAMTPEAFGDMWHADVKRWGVAVQLPGVKQQ